MDLVRNHSIIVFEGEVEELSSIKKFPVFIGSTDEPIENDVFSDLTFDICKTTGMIQLRNLVDPKLVYSKFHSEAIGKTWELHHESFSRLIRNYSKDKNVLEIGGSDSGLALKTLENIKSWAIIEPNLKFKYLDPKLSYIEDFFSVGTILNNYGHKFNLIVHSHVLEHTLEPLSFLHEINICLKKGDHHIFSVPNLYKYLENKFVNTINFEHTLFLTEEFIDFFLKSEGFKIIEKQNYLEHSIFYVTEKTNGIPFLNPPEKYKEYKKLYLDCYNYYVNFVEEFNMILEKTQKTVYLFGAHVFSQYLISLGLNTSKIECILDNSQLKRGKRLYGTNLTIKLPTDVKLDGSLIILKVGQYKDEIKNQLNNLSQKIEYYE